MAKKPKVSAIDFHFGIGDVIPSTQEAYHREVFEELVRKAEKDSLAKFKETVGFKLDADLKGDERFPSDGEIFVFIIQYFAIEREYARRDIDNMAKTILDVLKDRFYRDDSQVKTLLVSKKVDQRVPQNFAYVAVKELAARRDIDALKLAGIERAVVLFQELRSKGYI